MTFQVLIVCCYFINLVLAEEYLRALEINCQQQLVVLRASSLFWVDGRPATSRIEEILKMYAL